MHRGQGQKLLAHVNIILTVRILGCLNTFISAAVDCGRPPHLENGVINDTATSYQTIILYECNDGYYLDRQASRICQANGHWSGIQPECIGKYFDKRLFKVHNKQKFIIICDSILAIDCGLPNIPENGFIDVNETSFGSKTIYYCRRGYVLHGQQTRECLADRTWSNEVPNCERK